VSSFDLLCVRSLTRRGYGMLQVVLVAAVAMISSPAAAEKVLRIGVNALPPFLGNPFATTATPSITTLSAFFDQLTRVDRTGVVVPWLATRWENIDPYTWRFHLRKNVIFSNGAPFNASAVINTVNYLTSPESLTQGTRRELPFLKSVRRIDDYTVDIITSEQVPFFPRYTSSLVIAEPTAWRELGAEEYARQPVSTGPFRLDEWLPTKAKMTAFRESWRSPQVDRLEVIALVQISSRVQALQSGNIHISTNLGPDDIQAVEASGGTGMSWVAAAVQGISFVLDKPNIFDDVRIRRALNMAVNRDLITQALLDGTAVPAHQPAPRVAFGYNPSVLPYPYDLEAAEALLAEAGYPDGFSFTMETSLGAANIAAIYQQVAADLKRIGVEMIIRVRPVAPFLADNLNGFYKSDAVTWRWPVWPTVDVLRSMLIHSCRQRVPWYCDREFQPVIDAAFREWDSDKALELRHQIMQQYHDQAPAIFLYEEPLFAGLAPGVAGFEDIHGFVSYDQITIGD